MVERYLCLSVDVQGYGAHNDVEQAAIQGELVALLEDASRGAGLSRDRWIRQPKGDEELALIPPAELHHLVAGDFCLRLAALLRRGTGPGRLRLRLAMDEGPVQFAGNGFAGRAVVAASRLVNSAPLRQALELAPDAGLAVMLSHGVYRDWVGSGHSSMKPEWFRRVPVTEKEFAEDAWLYVPGADVHRLALTGAGPPPTAAAATTTGLPATGMYFYGRDAELARVVAAVRPTGSGPAVCTISGMAGVGKTTLAVQAAHRLLAVYPDGCLFVDLHGYHDRIAPKPPAEALHRLLRHLGVPAGQIPPDAEERADLFHARLHGRRILIVLDNARDVTQLRALLPRAATCGALITSRVRLTALDEATPLALGVLSARDGAELFASVAATDDDRALVDRVVDSCGRLPLAIRIVAARRRSDPASSLAELCERLDGEGERLAELDDGDRSVEACLAVSHAALPLPQKRMFALLARHPHAGFGVHAAAALAGLPKAETRRHLDGLVERHLLLRPAPDRYQFHDLVGAFARTRRPAKQRSRAVHRMVDFYLSVAASADAAIATPRYRVQIGVDHRPASVPDVRHPGRAVSWLATEERTLLDMCRLAAEHALDRQCWQLSHVLRGYYFLTKRWSPWAGTHEEALAATRRLADPDAEAIMLSNAGLVALEQGRPAAAAELYRTALGLFERVGDRHGASAARTNLAWSAFYLGNYSDFVRDIRRTFAFHTANGSTRNAAIALRGIALGQIELGEFAAAVRDLRAALAVFARFGADLDVAMTRNGLGEAYARGGDPVLAAAHHRRALDVSRRCGSAFEWARAQHRLGDLAAAGGDLHQARARWAAAHSTYRTLGAPQAAELVTRVVSADGSPALVGGVPRFAAGTSVRTSP